MVLGRVYSHSYPTLYVSGELLQNSSFTLYVYRYSSLILLDFIRITVEGH
jgi:hypothetical protein